MPFKMQNIIYFTRKIKFKKNECLPYLKEAQWLSGRVLDWRPKGHRFEPHQRHCVVSLSRLARHINPCLVLVQPRKTHPDISARLLTGTKRIKSNKPTNLPYLKFSDPLPETHLFFLFGLMVCASIFSCYGSIPMIA